MNRKRGNVVVSRRAILDQEQHAQRQKLVESLAEGQIFHGRVKRLTGYSVFVDLGGLDGLLHVSDLSWGRVTNPADVVRPGEEIDVQVLILTAKSFAFRWGAGNWCPTPGPPSRNVFRWALGRRVASWASPITAALSCSMPALRPGTRLRNELVEAQTAPQPSWCKWAIQSKWWCWEPRPDQRRISLGIKQAQPDPWSELAKKYPVGSQVSGRVRNLTEFGAFVEIEEGFDGLIHVSDVS